MPERAPDNKGYDPHGPTLFEGLFDMATQQPQREIASYLATHAEQAARDLAQLVNKAYAAGLRDGFQQGVEYETGRQADAR